jgi:hypothetical protein
MSVIYINPFQFGGYDPDAQDYINRVIAADVAAGNTSGLEVGVQDAINTFVVGCKADGIWNAIKASCILAGARTLAGALVPLVGTAPTNVNFVAGDYNRETGLLGNGSTKYLNSNRASTADPQDNCHGAVYATAALTVSSGAYFGSRDTVSGFNRNGVIASRSSGASTLNFSAKSGFNAGNSVTHTGLIGVARSSSSLESARSGGVGITFSVTSSTPGANATFIFAQNSFGTVNNYADARLPFYSIGESLDLALLDARVTTLMSDLAAAIP